jgi:hypothetical protein
MGTGTARERRGIQTVAVTVAVLPIKKLNEQRKIYHHMRLYIRKRADIMRKEIIYSI